MLKLGEIRSEKSGGEAKDIKLASELLTYLTEAGNLRNSVCSRQG